MLETPESEKIDNLTLVDSDNLIYDIGSLRFKPNFGDRRKRFLYAVKQSAVLHSDGAGF